MLKKNKLEKELSERQSETVRLKRELKGLRSAVLELKVLNDIAVAATKISTSEQMLELIVKKSIKAVDAEQGSILTVSKSEDKVVATMMRQDDDSKLKHNYHVSTNITGWVLLNKTPLIIEELSTDKRFSTTKEESKDIHSVLSVPIWFSGKILGILMMINKKSADKFNSVDLDLLSIIAIQAGQLIENNQLQREAFDKSKEVEITRLEKNKLTELDKLKTRFFANISHEFRTPLTLILDPVKEIISKTKEERTKQELSVVHRSANRILRLVNQLLDLSKLEAGKMALKASPENIVPLLKGLVSSFESIAERKKIALNFDSDKEKVIVYIDRDKIDKIVNNILSNAIKFTNENGSIYVKINTTNECVRISIKDTGIGIPGKRLEKIFDRFYQVDNSIRGEQRGTGIGLTLTKELVNLHKGEINVDSEEGKGTTFTIVFPIGKAHLKAEEIIEERILSEVESASETFENILETKKNESKVELDVITETDKPLILVVEDNIDVRNYIKGNLDKTYRVIEALNGEEAFDKSLEYMPDLIISDVMMPKMNGFVFCEHLKSDTRTSHIPVILLTAKASEQDKIEGLETGADDYLMKPFDTKELQVRILNLIEQRRRLKDHFRKEGILDLSLDDINQFDKKFLKRMIEIINTHLAETSFSVEDFAEEFAMNRFQLRRKLITMIGETPVEFIRRVRLTKAAKFIEQRFGNISEIALEVGFSNPAYFTKCFREQFGITPSDYEKQHPI